MYLNYGNFYSNKQSLFTFVGTRRKKNDWTKIVYYIVNIPSLPFPSLPFPSLPFPSLPFPSLPSLPFPSLPFPSLPFPQCPCIPIVHIPRTKLTFIYEKYVNLHAIWTFFWRTRKTKRDPSEENKMTSCRFIIVIATKSCENVLEI